MPRQGRPRTTGLPSQYKEGHISKHRIAWVDNFLGQFVFLAYPPGYQEDLDVTPEYKNEPGPTIRLMIQRKGRPTYLALTALTATELRELKRLFDLMFDEALPIVELRDKAAEDAYENGDDTFARIYRQVQPMAVRERAFTTNGLRVHDGPEDDASGDGGGGDPEGGLRGVRAELADGSPSADRAQDDLSEDDER